MFPNQRSDLIEINVALFKFELEDWFELLNFDTDVSTNWRSLRFVSSDLHPLLPRVPLSGMLRSQWNAFHNHAHNYIDAARPVGLLRIWPWGYCCLFEKPCFLILCIMILYVNNHHLERSPHQYQNCVHSIELHATWSIDHWLHLCSKRFQSR